MTNDLLPLDRATAGHLTLPHSDTTAKLVTKPARSARNLYRYHVIVKGTHPGVYEGHWYVPIYLVFRNMLMVIRNNFEHLVKSVPHANHKGFNSLEDARAAYTIASALGFVQAIPARGATECGPAPGQLSLVSTNPSQEDILAALSATSHDFLGNTWYTVTKGVRPGVYPCW